MSTITFTTTGTDGTVVYGGGFTDGFDGGRNDRHIEGQGRIDFVAHGTDCVFGFYSLGNWQWSVDGGADQFYTTAAGVWSTQSLFSSLSDGDHHVTIWNIGGGLQYVDSGNFLTVTGSAPAITTPAGMSASTYRLVDFTTSFRVDGSMVIGSTSGGTSIYFGGNSADGSIRFRATVTGLQVWGYGSGQKYRVAVDGVDSGVVYAGTTDRLDWIPLGTTYDGGAEHEYRISGHNQVCYFGSAMAIGGTASTATLADGGGWAFLGDSITEGWFATGHDNGLSYAHRIALARGSGVRNLGSSGASVVVSGAGEASQAVGFSPQPARVLVLFGVNDAASIGAAGETVPQFQAAYQSMVQSLIDGLPVATPIDCLMYLDTTSIGAGTNRTTMANAIQAAIAACTSHTHVRYIDTTGWIIPASDTSDGTHPNSTGYAKVAAAYLAIDSPPPTFNPSWAARSNLMLLCGNGAY